MGKNLREDIFLNIKLWFYKVLDFIDIFDWFGFKKNVEIIEKEKGKLLLKNEEEKKEKEWENEEEWEEKKEWKKGEAEKDTTEKNKPDDKEEDKVEWNKQNNENAEFITDNPREALSETTKKIAGLPVFEQVKEAFMSEDEEHTKEETALFEALKNGRLWNVDGTKFARLENYGLAGTAISWSVKLFQSLEGTSLLAKFPKEKKNNRNGGRKR